MPRNHLEISDFKGAALIVDRLPEAKALICDKGYDADWLRAALLARGIAPCIPPKSNCIEQIAYGRELYKTRHKVENMFGRLKDWRRNHTRYDRCAHAFLSAIVIAATVTFWL